MIRAGKVLHGPGVWLGKTGNIIEQNGVTIVLALEDKDDAGKATYHVRFPVGCVSVLVEPAAA